MDVREKLVELLQNAKAAMKSENLSCDIARNMFVVDFMMSYGVTVQKCKLGDKIYQTDVAPVRHGRWVKQDKYAFGTFYDCSICDNRILDTGHSWNYCPNCGCRMDGGDDE